MIRNSSGSPVSIAASEYSRTLCWAQTPPTKPSIVPSSWTSAASPGSTLVGRCTRTTVAITNRRAGLAELLRGRLEGTRDHCGGSARPCIAAHTRGGVHGMSMW